MTFPLWMLLGFAMWTVAVLLFTVGIYRWTRILTRRAAINSFRADVVDGDEWYRRAMRAHANCVENLPVFAVVVFALYASGISTRATDALAGVVLVARIVQSIVHVAFVQSNLMALTRFVFFFVQLVCFIAMAASVVRHAL